MEPRPLSLRATYSLGAYLNNNLRALDGSPFVPTNELLCKFASIMTRHNIEEI